MNVHPGGAQPCMRDTTWAGKVQKIVDDNGVPKVMRRVLEDNGINTARMNADGMRVVLVNHSDFEEKTVVETYLLNLGYQVSEVETYLLNLGYQVSEVETYLLTLGYQVSEVETYLLNLGYQVSEVETYL